MCHNSLSFQSIFILAHLKSHPNLTNLLGIISWLISGRNNELTHVLLLKHQQLKFKTWQSTSGLLIDTFDLVLKHCYIIYQAVQPRIATMTCTIEVMLLNNEAFFKRWVGHLFFHEIVVQCTFIDVLFIKANMSKYTFTFVCDEIKYHDVFWNNSNHPQAPVQWQLLVALVHLGLNGNGESPHRLAQVFNISGKVGFLIFQFK